MAEFVVNPQRFDPYKQFKFRVKWDGHYVAGVHHVSALRRVWANKVWHFGSGLGLEVSLEDFRKDVIIELLNEAGQTALAWKLFRCWPSDYVALGDLDAGNGAVAIESLTLQNEGWERDEAVTEPKEPSFNAP